MGTEFVSRELSADWQFRQLQQPGDAGTDGCYPRSAVSSQQWLSCSLPTRSQDSRLTRSRIQDPFVGFNEIDVEWVGQKGWAYRTSFAVEPLQLQHARKAVLAFDGLDTFATVRLNGVLILRSDNMFVAHRVDVLSLLQKDNVLEVDFESAWIKGKQLQQQHPDHKYVCFNGDPSRLCVRKAQYHYGWDWGPLLMTAGPWLPVRLELYTSRVSDLWTDVDVKADLSSATVVTNARFEGGAGLRVKFRVSLLGKLVAEETVSIDVRESASAEFVVRQPALWYPHGVGKQPLYNLTAILLDGTSELHSTSKNIGLRRAELVQEKDKYGKSFYFRINNVDVFCGGSDWIPADSFLPRISNDRYRQWLQLMVDGNQNMVRVWGGGIFEPDCFYDLCDELGILVWQDFLFGCGNYPAWPEYLESIKAECETQLRRIRHHPSIVILAGNNEDYQVQEQYGLEYDYEDKNQGNWLRSDFPARFIYEKLLPDAVSELCSAIPYHPGSPWGDGKLSSDPTVGDRHTWDVWHGQQLKYQVFDSLGGRFMSEFGMEAFPHLQTIREYTTDDGQLYPQSAVIDFHNKADGHERRLATYVVENMRMRTDLEGWIHLTQLVQSEALMYAYRGWRRQWGEDAVSRRCGGALCWQLNDCYPVTSWSIVDYYLRKKPAYYSMARVLRPLAVGIRRAHHDWSVVHARPALTSAYQLWAVSSLPEPVKASVELRYVSVSTGKDIRPVSRHEVQLTANRSTDILQGELDNRTTEPHVLAARLLVDGKVVARDMDWPQPLKYLDLSDRGVVVEWSDDRSEVAVSCQKPVKGFVFEERTGVWLSDSALDLVPGDTQTVSVRGLDKKDDLLSYRYLDCPF